MAVADAASQFFCRADAAAAPLPQLAAVVAATPVCQGRICASRAASALWGVARTTARAVAAAAVMFWVPTPPAGIGNSSRGDLNARIQMGALLNEVWFRFAQIIPIIDGDKRKLFRNWLHIKK